MEEIRTKIKEAEKAISDALNPILDMTEARELQIKIYPSWKEDKTTESGHKADVKTEIRVVISPHDSIPITHA